MKRIPAFVIAFATVVQATPSDTCNQKTWFTNGPVEAIAVANDKVYISGTFTQVCQYSGAWVPLDSSTGMPPPAYPKINGTINATCPDGNGGWYVGGAFTSVNGVPRNNLAHVLSGGALDPVWNPNADSIVRSLVVSGTTVYVAGDFISIGGKGRNNIAALSATTGNVSDWNPNSDGIIYCLAVSGTTVYAGGFFTSIDGKSRNRIAALDATTGNATDWNPNANNGIFSLAADGTTIYAGGDFDSIGGQKRSCIAALDATTGNATAWNPNANGNSRKWSMCPCQSSPYSPCCVFDYPPAVYSLAVSGASVYAGGEFLNIGGQSRKHIAVLDATTGNATAWDPGIDSSGYVKSLVVSRSTIYAGGSFSNIGSKKRKNIAALDATTGNATAWVPAILNGDVQSLAVDGTTVLVGGLFDTCGLVRNGIAALDAATGRPTDWNPNASTSSGLPSITSLVVSGATVYAAGNFGAIGGQYRNDIAALDATTGNALPWNNPNSDGARALAVSETTVYVGGTFDSVGGQIRHHIAALDATTGNVLPWNPNAQTYAVLALILSGTTLYAGGNFTSISGQSRNNIAALNATTGNALVWNPNANDQIFSLALGSSTVYAGGYFTSIGGQNRNRLAALDATTGNILAWNPDAEDALNNNIFIDALAVNGTTVYAGGQFQTIGGQIRNNIAALDATTGNALDWNPNAVTGNQGGNVVAIAVSGTTVYLGGFFSSIGQGQGLGHPYFAQFGNYNPNPVIQPISRPFIMKGAGLQIINSHFLSAALVKFAYSLPQAENVSLRLYSVNGQLQSELVNKHQPAGNYSFTMQRNKFAAGAYLVVFKAGDFHQEMMISLMK
jgi:trimeric autotransporter adhesin